MRTTFVSNGLEERPQGFYERKPFVLFIAKDESEVWNMEQVLVDEHRFLYAVTSEWKQVELSLHSQIPIVIVLLHKDGEQVDPVIDAMIRQYCEYYKVSVVVCNRERTVEQPRLFNYSFANPYDKKDLIELVKKLIQLRSTSYIDLETGLLNQLFFERVYKWQLAACKRTKVPFSLVFLSLHSYDEWKVLYDSLTLREIKEEWIDQIQEKVRDSDFVFSFGQENEVILLLPYTGGEEARSFLNRLENDSKPLRVSHDDTESSVDLQISGVIVEIRQSSAEHIEVTRKAREMMASIEVSSVATIEDYVKKEVEPIKVTIIEPDDVFRHVLVNLMNRLEMEGFEFVIKDFEDGQSFLDSDYYQSAHTHIVILNDILPQRSGLELVYELRGMPNTNKYLITMLSTRRAEEDMIYAFESGVDEYIVKPFTIHLLEAKIKRLIRRYR
ncbi:GGDEF domain-containing response regulator [Alkalihalobacillus hemicellulosilyticus]|uniref:Two component transcriptional regulator n=1 Tax=Halalkalibacter hemicellulosilyticusJCM 9152 TaxID=1236971 RepID=W4QI75_9BACI|nr:response regulator [Halalkalibacter hemicellulosilyticus]GAE31830.1 two component transcriptional regulator [Halalkalibacter hemicellulosilyticusJCM 9152]